MKTTTTTTTTTNTLSLNTALIAYMVISAEGRISKINAANSSDLYKKAVKELGSMAYAQKLLNV